MTEGPKPKTDWVAVAGLVLNIALALTLTLATFYTFNSSISERVGRLETDMQWLKSERRR